MENQYSRNTARNMKCITYRKSSNNSFRSGKNNLGSKTASNANAALNKNESPSSSKTSHTCAQVLISK